MDTVSAIYTESYRQRLDLNFKAAVQTVNAHLNQNHTFPEFSFLAFSVAPWSSVAHGRFTVRRDCVSTRRSYLYWHCVAWHYHKCYFYSKPAHLTSTSTTMASYLEYRVRWYKQSYRKKPLHIGSGSARLYQTFAFYLEEYFTKHTLQMSLKQILIFKKC